VSHSSSVPLRPFPTSKQRRPELTEALQNAPGSPCIDQTQADIEAYYRKAQIGTRAAVRQTHGGVLRYDLTEIDGTNPKLGRLYVRAHGAFYMKHGKNCWHPTGQTRLVVPNDAVVAWALEHPTGALGFVTFEEGDCSF
jgi:hypothetical protein